MTILLNTSWLTLPSSSIRIYSVLSDYSSSMVSMIIHSFPIAGKTFGLTSNSQNIDSGCLELSWKKETGCFQVQQELVPWMTLLEIRKWWYDMSFLRLTAPPHWESHSGMWQWCPRDTCWPVELKQVLLDILALRAQYQHAWYPSNRSSDFLKRSNKQ